MPHRDVVRRRPHAGGARRTGRRGAPRCRDARKPRARAAPVQSHAATGADAPRLSGVQARVLDVDRASAGARLDRWLAAAVPEQSRAKIQALIEGGRVRVDGAATKASHRLRGGERVAIEIPPPPAETLEPEAIALTVVHED